MVIAESMKPSTQSLIAEQSLRRSQAYLVKRQESATSKKYDLTKWKFADLRDAINTSCGEWVRVSLPKKRTPPSYSREDV